MNRTLKEPLTKLSLEIGADGVALLPVALHRVRNSPYQMGLTLFEIMFGTPPSIISNFQADLLDDQDLLDAI